MSARLVGRGLSVRRGRRARSVPLVRLVLRAVTARMARLVLLVRRVMLVRLVLRVLMVLTVWCPARLVLRARWVSLVLRAATAATAGPGLSARLGRLVLQARLVLIRWCQVRLVLAGRRGFLATSVSRVLLVLLVRLVRRAAVARRVRRALLARMAWTRRCLGQLVRPARLGLRGSASNTWAAQRGLVFPRTLRSVMPTRWRAIRRVPRIVLTAPRRRPGT